MRTRLLGAVLTAVFVALAWQAPAAHAAGLSLTPDATAVHVGETILLTADFCATGNTVDLLEVTVASGGPSGPATTTALDPGIVTQTVDGFSFLHTTTTEETAVWFAATCSDASTASSSATPVLVYPTVGLLWWQAPAEGFGAGVGGTGAVSATSIDCVEGSTATAELLVDGTTVSSITGVVTGGALQFDLPIPIDTPGGRHEVLVSCDAIAGGQIVDSHPFSVTDSSGVGGGGGSIPVTGRSLPLGLAVVLVLTGLALVWFSRQPAPAG
ncbi:MAG: hypothetical protein RL238_3150 [Actinomycetota bacterium]|jgi:hypothetical protein